MITAHQFLAEARTHLGYREQANGWTKFGDAYGDPYGQWCAWFLSHCAKKIRGQHRVGQFGNTVEWARWFDHQGKFRRKPRVGSLAFFNWGNGAGIQSIDHVGVVEHLHHDGTIQTIEGNTGDMVARRRRNPANIVGYGHPKWDRPPPDALRIGSTGHTVHWLQVKLGGLATDGVFGPATQAAVRHWQKAHGLLADGIVGPQTWRTLGR